MAYDGTLLFGTGIDTSAFQSDVSGLISMGTQAAAAVTATFTAASAAAIKVGSDFEASMSQVAATMGITSAAAEFETLSAAAKEMGESTKFSASQAGEALNYLALAGYNAEKAVAALPTVLNVAAAGGIDLAYASDMITDAMSALGLEMSDMEVFADQLAVTSQKSNTSVAQLGEAILTVGGTAKSLSGGITEMNTALGLLADNGVKGAEGGTALRNIILSLSAPTDKAAAALDSLGVTAFDANGSMRPLEDTFYDLNLALDALGSDQAKTEALNEIFNKVDLKSVNALLGTSMERFEELTGYIDDCSGAAAQMAKTMDDNLPGDLTILGSALEGLGIAAYEKFQVPMRTAVQEVTGDVGTLTESLTEGELSGSMDKIASGFGKLATSVMDFTADTAIPTAIDFFEFIADHGQAIITTTVGIGSAFAAWKVGAVVSEAVTAVRALKAANEGAAIAQMALNTAMEANPVGLVLVAVTGLTAGLIALGNAIDSVYANKEAAERSINEYEEQRSKVEELANELESVRDRIEEIQSKGTLNITYENELQELQEQNDKIEARIELEKELLRIKQEQADKDTLAALNSDDVTDEGSFSRLQLYIDQYNSFSEQMDELRSKLSDASDEEAESIQYSMARLEYQMNDTKAGLVGAWESTQELVDALDSTSEKGAAANQKMNELSETIQNMIGLEPEEKSVLGGQYTAGSWIASDYTKRHDAEKKAADDAAQDLADSQEENTNLLKAAWKKAEHEYATGMIASEKDLYAQKSEILAQYGNADLEEHWKYYEDLYRYQQDYSKESAKLAKEVAEKEKQIFKGKWESITLREQMGLLTEQQALEERRKLFNENFSDFDPEKDYLSDAYDYYKQIYNDETKITKEEIKKQEKIVDDGLSDILKRYQKAYDELEKKRENYRQRLLKIGGNIFSVKETEDKNGKKTKTYTVNNIDEQIKKMREYHANIKELKNQGMADGLLEEMGSLDPEDSAQFAKYLSGMSEAEFGKINSLYKEKDDIAKELSEDLYKSEAQKISDSMTMELADLAVAAYDYGAQSGEQFAAGFNSAIDKLGIDALYGQYQAAGATKIYENYAAVSKDDREFFITLDLTGKSNVYMDSAVVGTIVTNQQTKQKIKTGG